MYLHKTTTYTMNKNTFYIIVIIGLMASNLLLASFLLFKKPPHPHHPHKNNPRKIIIERLHFDADQVKAYTELIDVHGNRIQEKEKVLRSAKNELYALLVTSNELRVDSLSTVIANTQKEIEIIHFNHFKDIKNICKNDTQQADFEALATELSAIFSPKPPRR